MKLSVLKAKVQRNNLIKHAGKYYVDETSQIVKKLNEHGKHALLGIQNKKGAYTIIGERFIHYSTPSGKNGEISLKQFTDELHHNGNIIGKGYFTLKFRYKSIVLDNGDKVWLYNSNTMFSLWNTCLWLQKLV